MAIAAANSSYYEKLLFTFKNAAAFMPVVMIPFGLLARGALVDGRYYSGDAVFAMIVGAYLIASGMSFHYTQKYPHSTAVDVAFAIIFHLLTLLFILFVSGFLSAFLSVWIVLMISTDLRFGMRGFFLSFAGLCAAGALMLLIHTGIAPGEKIEILQGAIVVGAIGFVIAKIRTITDHERRSLAQTRKKESYQRERLLALVNSMGDAVLATNEQGIIKVHNSTLLDLLGAEVGVTGRPIDAVLQLHDSDGRPVNIMPEAQVRHAVFSRTDLAREVSKGETMHLYINVAPIQPAGHGHTETGFIFILRDITKEKTLEEQRDEFISVVSHELRTPVAIAEAALSNIQILLNQNADRRRVSATLDDAYKNVIYLAKLVNDLSTLAKAERGMIGSVELVSVPDVLRAIYANYQPQVEAKKLKFELEIDPKTPEILTSPLYFQEIMQNLITNALKYTKKGSITIKTSLRGGRLHIAVIDTGIGISKSDQAHLFQKFYRSEDFRTRETGGTGLGLYVCRKLAENVGMNLEFYSRLNYGSTFTLSIPVKPSARVAQAAAAKAVPPAKLKPSR